MVKFVNGWIVLLACTVLCGCANMNYDHKLTDVSAGILRGDPKASLALLQASSGHENVTAAHDSDDLLFQLEAGALQQLNGDVAGSTASWMQADRVVRQWEDQVRSDPVRLVGEVGAWMINDTVRRYDGRDYEKVLLNVGLALNHVAMQDWDSARIEIRRMHERQDLIAEFRARELQKAAEAAAARNVRATSFRELGGYPIQYLEAPEVQSLKNAYESAFANYLAGFVYEALGEPSLAAPGYRKALEMRPHVPLLEDAIAGLDGRIHAAQGAATDDVDVLFVVESGLAPAIRTQKFGLVLPVPCRDRYCPELVPLSWPVIAPVAWPYPIDMGIDAGMEPLVLMSSVNAMARRALYDEMPAILTRTAVRALSKVAAQKAADDAASQNAGALGPLGGLLSLATKVAVSVTDVADERAWRTLPDSYLIARKTLKKGAHQIVFNLNGTVRVANFTVSGKYALVSMRVVGNQLYVTPQKAG